MNLHSPSKSSNMPVAQLSQTPIMSTVSVGCRFLTAEKSVVSRRAQFTPQDTMRQN